MENDLNNPPTFLTAMAESPEKKKIKDMKLLFGSFKFSKPTQQIKDEMREGWE